MQSSTRFTLWLLGLALLSTLLIWLTAPHPSAKHNARRIDRFSIQPNFRQYNAQGHATQLIAAQSATHETWHDQTHFVKPVIQTVNQDGTPIHITANTAKSLYGNQVIVGNGNVVVRQAGRPGHPPATLYTQHVVYHHNTNTAMSNQRVKIVRPNSITTGRGLVANFTTGKDVLEHDGKVIYGQNNH